MKYLVFAAVLLTIFSCSIFCNSQATNDDIALMRQRVLEMGLWPSKNNLSNIVQLAYFYNNKMNSSCYWEDINYNDTTPAVWATEEHLIRVNYMLQALTAPGSSAQNDSRLASDVHCALNVWLVRDFLHGGWFDDIGIPLLITSQLLMLGDNATNFETEKITQISYRSNWWQHDSNSSTGANLVWMLQVQLYRSLATKNRTGLAEASARMWRDVAVLPLGGQGIQSDWSYHFHGLQLTQAGYGQDWAVAIMIFMVSTKGTQYEPDQGRVTTFATFLTEGNAWMINNNIWDWQVQGRDFDRPGTVFASLGFEVEPDWVRSLADLVDSTNLKTDLLNFADRLDAKASAVPLIGNKHFYTSDYQVHRRMNWTSAIKMQSIRTQPTECINGENQKGEHLGQGVLTVYTTNASDYLEIFPLFDWQSINGITVEHDVPLEPCKGGVFNWTKLSFVGGVSDGDYGLAMMDTATHDLTAKRSWHFYDDGIIALASNLTLTTQNTAWTALVSRLLPTGNVTLGFFNGTFVSLSDGINYSFPYTTNKSGNVQWIHISESNIGYLLQTQELYSAVGAEVSTKTASYNTIGPYNNTVTARTVTVWIDHGLGPYMRDYSYIVLPNVSVTSMPELIKRYDNEQIFSCLLNNDLFHGVAWPTLQRASFVLWDNATRTFSCQSSSFKINARLTDAGVYLFNETTTDFSVTVSHPTRINGTVTITVDRVGFGQGCTALSDSTTNVTIVLPSSSQFLGSSVTVTCKKRQIQL
jgi:chondroitin AC lyase